MRKAVLLFTVAVAVLSGCKNADYSVWNEPFADTNTWNGPNNWTLTVTKVVFGDAETSVYVNCKRYEGSQFTFQPETYLKVGETRYPMTGADGITPGQFFMLQNTRSHNIILHFEPLPKDTKSFDLIEGDNIPGAFNIFGIHEFDENSSKLAKTHWRDKRTGNWTISLMDGFVIYDNRIWKCDNGFKETAGTLDFTMDCEGQIANVHFGKIRNGIRKITVDGKSFKCDRFESKYVPDYPVRGRHATKLRDFGYDKTDSVTISGILIRNREMEIAAKVDMPDGITGAQPSYVGTVKENGSFSITFPVVNTSYISLRLNMFYAVMSIPVEPGGNYFILYDMTQGGCEYVMGDNSRLLNEDLAYGEYFYCQYERIDDTDSDLVAYLDYLINTRERFRVRLDSLKKTLPHLSDAYWKMAEVTSTVDMYENIGQARFNNSESRLIIPESMLSFMKEDLAKQDISPYSLSFSFGHFMRDFTESLTLDAEYDISLIDILDMMEKNGKVKLSPENKSLMVWYSDFTNRLNALVRSMAGEESDVISEAVSKYMEQTGDTLMKVEAVLSSMIDDEEELNSYAMSAQMQGKFDFLVNALDSLDIKKDISDLALTHFLANNLNSIRHSLPAVMMAEYDSIVTFKAAKESIHKLNDKYLALENADLASLGNNVTPELLANISDGESILRKITEPYRGRIVYIDVWGSWCHPCLENLSKAHELKEQLKDYDIVYLYLANATTDSAWKGVIKEYDLTGENCIHYNLPAREQSLIEQYLQVEGFPTYRLLNRHGALIDGNFHPSNISALKATLDKL